MLPPFDSEQNSSTPQGEGRLHIASSSLLIFVIHGSSTVNGQAFPVATARVCHAKSSLHYPWEVSAVVWRLTFSAIPFLASYSLLLLTYLHLWVTASILCTSCTEEFFDFRPYAAGTINTGWPSGYSTSKPYARCLYYPQYSFSIVRKTHSGIN